MSNRSSIALVTGGNRGLGRSTVEALARRGVSSIFTYNTSREKADEVVDLADRAGIKAVPLQLDTSRSQTFEAFAETVEETLSTLGADRFDYMVNNAGNSSGMSF